MIRFSVDAVDGMNAYLLPGEKAEKG